MRVASVVVASYLLGCIVAAYYIVRARSSVDIRDHGSRNAGARNVMRVAGRGAAMLTLAFDFSKGFAAVWLAGRLVPGHLADWGAGLAFIAVVAGHIWPIQLSFHGGRGAATGLGGLLAADWRAVALGTVVVLVAYGIARQQTPAAMAGFAVTPFLALLLDASLTMASLLAVGCALVMIAHHGAFDRLRRERNPAALG